MQMGRNKYYQAILSFLGSIHTNNAFILYNFVQIGLVE